MPQEKRGRIKNAQWEAYTATLVERYRRPGRGGNTNALHRHAMLINGEWYSWFPLGSRKWVYARDHVSFEYTIDDKGFRNVVEDTLRTVDEKGLEQVRGNRGFKAVLRTAPERLPGRQNE
jgi:hypothetical protein